MANISSFLGGLAGGSLGTLFVQLTADSSKLIAGFREAEGQVNASSAIMLRQVGVLAAGLTTSFGIIGVAALREFSKFDQAMTNSLSIMGDLSDGTKRQMAELAKSLSGETVQSADQLAKAYFFLGSAGFSAQQAMAALPIVAKFATAGNFDLERATTLLADAQSSLGLKVEDTTQNMQNMVRVSDALSKANILANADIQQFSEALTTKAGAALRNINKDVEEGVAVLADLADQGVKGAAAGDQLAIVLRDLQKASIDNRQAFIDMGITVFDGAGKMRNLADIIRDVEKALAGASDEEKRMAFQMLGFQDRSLAAILSLVGTSDKIRDYEKAIRSAGGATEDIATKQLTSFSAQLTITLNLFKDLLITIGEGLAPTITSLNDSLKEMLKTNSASNESLKETASIIGTALVDAGKGVMFIFGGIRDFLKVVLLGFLELGKAVTQLQLALISLAEFIVTKFVSTVIDGFNLLIKGINKVLDEIPASIKDKLGLSPIKQIANDFTIPLVDEIKDNLKGMLQTIDFTKDDIWSGLVKTSVGAAQELKAPAQAIAQTFKATATAVTQSAAEMGKAVSQVRTLIDSAKTTELLKLLGRPTDMPLGTAPSASELLRGISQGQSGTIDSTKAAEMLKAAGITEGARGGVGELDSDPLSAQSKAIQREIDMNKSKLKILQDLGAQDLKLTQDVQKKKADAIEAYNVRVKQLQLAQAQVVVGAGQQMFDDLGNAIAGFTGKQSAAYKAMFAISKAFAIADAVIKIQQGVANALSLPFPANLVAAASVVSAAASIITTIQSVRLELDGQRAEGGPVQAGKTYLVGERGAELFSPSQSGTIIPNDQLGGGGIKVVVNNYTDAQASVNQSQNGQEKVIEITIRRLKNEISSEVRDGRGEITKAMEQTWGLKRNR